MWEIIRAAGPLIYPILLCSCVGLAFFLERLLALRHHRIVIPEIVEAVETLERASDFSVAYAILDRKPGPFANLVRTGLDHAGDDWEIIRDSRNGRYPSDHYFIAAKFSFSS